MDKKQVRKHKFLDFVVYKIFSSEYNENFVLEGSESIFIKSLNRRLIYYKLPKDLDLNIISLKGTSEKIKKTLKEIFQEEKDIVIKLDERLLNTSGRIQFKIKHINDEENNVSNLSVDIVIENQNFNIELEEFNFDNKKINIQTYNIEKYIANKIVAMRKINKENEHFLSQKNNLDNFISKDEYKNITEICWLFKYYDFEVNELIRNIKLMYKPEIFGISLFEYIKYLTNYFTKNVNNKKIELFINNQNWKLEHFNFITYLLYNFENLRDILEREERNENRTNNL
ncbi:nucleotidyl transferase AbiEii/AbiGii toxin family protein [Mycoplasma procyoni]|uniref:nucleotidyl transferase AbiEii/AbiGii toxin family protein n=1 Tax=Mycoplasma procyoni TaxID=568784 RepID=UPI00197C1425|nr:nucleotidyl transferase AbiEii/AbiGii toxin family protein [Mycoplasma procyoni]MBN3534710.1 nucleotidyl transferase AbiEii/AbiGii toxin family protein [Mycoplasma procyoni]